MNISDLRSGNLQNVKQTMKNNITTLIESGYADLRKSEKQAADYILEHMEQALDLPLDRLAKAAGVSQPTVLRMLKALGYKGYKDFRYQLVAELAKSGNRAEDDGQPQLMYGYTLDKKDGLEDIPVNTTMTTEKMLEETLKNFRHNRLLCRIRSTQIPFKNNACYVIHVPFYKWII